MITYVSSPEQISTVFCRVEGAGEGPQDFLPAQGSEVVFGGRGPGAGPQGFHPGQSSTASSCGVPPQRAMLREPRLAEQLAAVPVPDTVILAHLVLYGTSAWGQGRSTGGRVTLATSSGNLPRVSLQLFDELLTCPLLCVMGFVVLSARWFVQFMDEVDILAIVQRQALGSRQCSNSVCPRLQVCMKEVVINFLARACVVDLHTHKALSKTTTTNNQQPTTNNQQQHSVAFLCSYVCGKPQGQVVSCSTEKRGFPTTTN